jgi:hypothetical protein
MIKIKKSHRGLFTKEAMDQGLTPAAFQRKVLVPGSKASKAVKKRAQFRKNAMGWQH